MKAVKKRKYELKEKKYREYQSKDRAIRFSQSELIRLEDMISERSHVLPWHTSSHYWVSAAQKIGLNKNLAPPKAITALVLRGLKYPSSFNVDESTLQFCIFAIIFYFLEESKDQFIIFDALTIKDSLRKVFNIHESYEIKYARTYAQNSEMTINFEMYTNETIKSYLSGLEEQGFIISNGKSSFASENPMRADIKEGIERILSQ